MSIKKMDVNNNSNITIDSSHEEPRQPSVVPVEDASHLLQHRCSLDGKSNEVTSTLGREASLGIAEIKDFALSGAELHFVANASDKINNTSIESNHGITDSNTESPRKLASIQVVLSINTHTGANALELVTILGWQVITGIGDTSVGMKVIYFEIDSLLPVDAPWLPQPVKDRIVKDQIKDGFRVKTIKLRGELSQGLLISIPDSFVSFKDLDIGTDVTKVLGVRKYEPPLIANLFQSKNGGQFPSHLVGKTDEPRVQSNPELFDLLQGKPYYMTVKMDGSSATYLLDPNTGELLVCSRNMIRERPDDISLCPYWNIAQKYDIGAKLKLFPHMAIQCEICGPNIQKNLLGLKRFELYVFNIVDIRDRRRLNFKEMAAICDTLGIPIVPLEESGENFQYENIKSLLTKAQGLYTGTKNAREGLVIRSVDQSISFKAINNDYLLKNGY